MRGRRDVHPNVEVDLFDHCGHAPMIKCAQRFNETALAFWQRVDDQREATAGRSS